ncbi:MAG: hypothetical protein WCO48_02835 [Candidatus Taylorbacteria bacterium]
MATNKYAKLDLGTIEAVFNKLGGIDGAERFIRGEVVISEPAKRWREQDGAIYFTLPVTEGLTGPQWIERLEKKNLRVGDWAKDVLGKTAFKPTTGVVREIAVLKGMLFEDNNRTTKGIRAAGDKRKLKHGKASEMNAEIACQIREMFTDKEIEDMGLIWIVVMHDLIKDSDGDLNLLDADRDDDGRWLDAYYDGPDDRFRRESGFAFVVSQVQN